MVGGVFASNASRAFSEVSCGALAKSVPGRVRGRQLRRNG